MGDGAAAAELMKAEGLFLSLLFVFTLIFTAACREDRQQNVWLDDRAGLLQPGQKERLNSYHAVLLDQLDVHFKLVILDRPAEDIDTKAVAIFGNLGAKTSGARGLLFLIDPKSEKVRIEVGYDLEHILPDGFVGNIEELQMKPFFARGMIGEGIEATGELLVQRLLEQDQRGPGKNRQLPEPQYYSGGAGAKVDTSAQPGQYEKEAVVDSSAYSGALTPEEALELYKQVLHNRVKDPDLPLFTPETRRFFSQWLVTDAQQISELKSLQHHTPETVRVHNDLAVIRFSVEERTVPPYFLRKGENGWMLDFAAMSRVIQMNHRNQWRLKNTDHPYMFGFTDLRFDGNGFPVARSRK